MHLDAASAQRSLIFIFCQDDAQNTMACILERVTRAQNDKGTCVRRHCAYKVALCQ